jgi:hypothetical protein
MNHAAVRAAAVMNLKNRAWGHHPLAAAMTMRLVGGATTWTMDGAVRADGAPATI